MIVWQTLLFDLDGTLIDSRFDLADAVNHALREIGHPEQSVEKISSHVGNGLRFLLTQTLGPVSDEQFEHARKAFDGFYNEHCTDKTTLYPEVEKDLAEFSKKYKLGVVSNKPEKYIRRILKNLKIDAFIPVALGGDSLPQCKPDPAPLIEAVKRLKGKISSTMIVGDGHQDIKAGHAAGIKTCLVTYGFSFRPEFKNLNPHFSIDKFSELKEILK